MNKKIIIITTILAFFINLGVKAQTQSMFFTDLVPSPNVQDFCRYGNIPMNYYTGRADVSVPIYNTTQKGVPLDISFKYETGGLKMNQLPTWTGHGWSLNVGGVITRIKNGAPDEFREERDINYKGYFHNISNINTYINQYGISDRGLYEVLSNSPAEKCDLCPDVFVFNFMGYSGRFFLNSNNVWCVQSDHNIKVELDIYDSTNYIYPFTKEYPSLSPRSWAQESLKGFTLIDENGTRYVFGGTTDAIEYSNYHFQSPYVISSWIPDSWYLTKVIDRHQNVLYDLTYERGKFILQVQNYLVLEQQIKSEKSSGYSYNSGVIETTNNSYPNLPYQFTLNAPVYLSKIHTYDNYDIDFSLSNTIRLKASADIYKTLIDNVIAAEDSLYRRRYIPFNIPREYAGEFYYKEYNGIQENYEHNYNTILSGGTVMHHRWPPFLRYALYYTHHSENTYSGIEPYYEAKEYFYYLTKIDPNHTEDFDANTSPDYTKYWCDSTAKKRAWDLGHWNPQVADYMNPIDAIEFIPLEHITITDPSGKKIRYTLTYDKKPRLHLTDISMYSYSNDEFVKEQNYHFNYQDYDKLDNDYTTRQTDYWGYYNGAKYTYDAIGIPYSFGLTPLFDAYPDKTAHPDLAQYGMLKEIIYPTGGKSVFEYEGNNYSQQLTYDRQTLNNLKKNEKTGGLRIKKISEYDSEGELLKSKTYDYTLENGLSSGQSFIKPEFEAYYELNNGSIKYQIFNHKPCGIVPVSNSYGIHVGYSRVTETLSDGTKIIRKFTNLGDYKDTEPIISWKDDSSYTPYDDFSERGYMCGKLLSEEVFDNNGDLLSASVNKYTIDYPRKFVLSYPVHPLFQDGRFCTYNNCAFIVGNIHKLIYSRLNLVSNVTKVKHDNGYVTDSVKYYINDLFNGENSVSNPEIVTKCLSKTVYRKKDNLITDSIRTNYNYPRTQDFVSQYFFPVIGEMNYHNNYFMGGKKTEYNKDNEENSLFNLNLLVPTKEMVFTPIGKNDKDSITTITYNSFDTDGIVKTYTEPGKCMTKLFYETIAGAKRLVARVTCASGYYGITCNPVAADPRYIIQKNGVSIFNIPETEAIVYSYDTAGRVSSITSGSGQSLYYVYDNVMRLSIIKDQNGKIVKRYTYNYKNK